MKKILLLSFLVSLGFVGFSQTDVFHRDNTVRANFWDDENPWYYANPDNNQNRPDNFVSSINRHNVFIGHNNQTNMSVNGAFFVLRSLNLESGGTNNRTFIGNPDDGSTGISLTNGLFNNANANSGVIHTFNVRIGIDASSVILRTTNNDVTTNYNREIFGNNNNIRFEGAGNTNVSAIISGTGASLTKEGSGILTLSAENTYAGLTTINGGTLRLNRTNGGTIPATNNITVSGGVLRISTNQTLNNLTVESGASVQVDAGVTLTINGSYAGTGTIDNKGTIRIGGNTAKTFPLAGSIINNGTPDHMNNLIIDNVEGVTLGRSFTVNGSLTLANGATTIGANNTLTINGNLFSAPGSFIGSPTSSIVMGGNGSLNFVGSDAKNFLKNLTVTNSAQVALDNTLIIVAGTSPGTVTVSGSGKLFTNGNLVLKSDADGTARIAEITSTDALPISGTVRVERFIPMAPIANGNEGRAWRLLSFPVTGSSAIWQAWGNGAAPRVFNLDPTDVPIPAQSISMGTLITGHAYSNAAEANAAGYDWWPALFTGVGQAASTSIRRFTPGRNNGNGAWLSNVASRTTASTQLSNADPAYMLFVRGFRNVAVGGNSATLAPRGDLRIGNVTSTVPPTSAGNFFTYGNPYASTINFGAIYDDASNTGLIKPVMHIWDATLNGTNGLGGYRSVTKVGGTWEDNLDGAQANIQFIHSGQGVLLESNSLAGGTLTTKEAHKVGGVPFIRPFSAVSAGRERLYARLYFSATSGEPNLIDGAVAGFGNEYNLDATDAFDNLKPLSITGSLSLGYTQAGKLLSFEGRPPVQDNDVLYLQSNGLGARSYTLEFEAREMQQPGRKAFLKDKFLGTETEIPLTGEKFRYPFEGNSGDAASTAANRFEVVFKVVVEKWIVLAGRAARPNIFLDWKIPSSSLFKTYIIEQSGNNVRYQRTAEIPADANAGLEIAHILSEPGGGVKFFRVQGITHTGETITSNEVLIGMNAGTAVVTVSPNPVSAPGAVSLVISNLEKANYTVSLLNASGNPVANAVIRHDGEDQVYPFQIPANLAPGVYYIQLRGKGGNIVKTLLIK